MSDNFKRFVRYVLPAIFYMAVIFTISSIPRLSPPSLGVEWDDKIYHFIEYAGFFFLLYRALKYWGWAKRTGRKILLAIFLGSAIGAIDELYQASVPTRVPDVSDWIADSTGVVLACLIFLLVQLIVKRRSLRLQQK